MVIFMIITTWYTHVSLHKIAAYCTNTKVCFIWVGFSFKVTQVMMPGEWHLQLHIETRVNDLTFAVQLLKCCTCTCMVPYSSKLMHLFPSIVFLFFREKQNVPRPLLEVWPDVKPRMLLYWMGGYTSSVGSSLLPSHFQFIHCPLLS